MTLNEYQTHALKTRIYPPDIDGINYSLMSLLGEVGEIANKYKKVLRGDYQTRTEWDSMIGAELGDALWYMAVLAHELGFTLKEIALLNQEKLASRRRRNVIQGSGDDR